MKDSNTRDDMTYGTGAKYNGQTKSGKSVTPEKNKGMKNAGSKSK